MLVLNRNIGESIYIGDDIRITILNIDHKQARIGIRAPREVPVHREEIYYRVKFNNEESSTVNGNAPEDIDEADSLVDGNTL